MSTTHKCFIQYSTNEIIIVTCKRFFFCFFWVFLSFCHFLGHSRSSGGSQARGPIGAVAAGLHQSHSNSGSERRLQPTPQLTAMPDP